MLGFHLSQANVANMKNTFFCGTTWKIALQSISTLKNRICSGTHLIRAVNFPVRSGTFAVYAHPAHAPPPCGTRIIRTTHRKKWSGRWRCMRAEFETSRRKTTWTHWWHTNLTPSPCCHNRERFSFDLHRWHRCSCGPEERPLLLLEQLLLPHLMLMSPTLILSFCHFVILPIAMNTGRTGRSGRGGGRGVLGGRWGRGDV